MKKIVIICLLISPIVFFSCTTTPTTPLVGNWVKRSAMNALARGDASSFSIGTKGYIYGGYDGKNRFNDLWEYDSDLDSWTQKASLDSIDHHFIPKRMSACGFSIGSKGYVGTGYDGYTYLKDFYEFNPQTNIWTKKADFGGTARLQAVGFGSATNGYIGSGFDGNYKKDFWKFDPNANTWTEITSKGSKRQGAFVFQIDNLVYLGGGIDNGGYVDDFYMFNPADDSWTEKRRIASVSTESYDDAYLNIVRTMGVGFNIGSKGYIATGDSKGNTLVVWEYEPTTDLWTKKSPFEVIGRTGAVSFSIGGKGFIASGASGGSSRFDDIWEFKPNDESNLND